MWLFHFCLITRALQITICIVVSLLYFSMKATPKYALPSSINLNALQAKIFKKLRTLGGRVKASELRSCHRSIICVLLTAERTPPSPTFHPDIFFPSIMKRKKSSLHARWFIDCKVSIRCLGTLLFVLAVKVIVIEGCSAWLGCSNCNQDMYLNQFIVFAAFRSVFGNSIRKRHTR